MSAEELEQILPFLDELDPAQWHLIGYDTYAQEFYRLYQEFDSEVRAQAAAIQYLFELEESQPSSVSGGQSDNGIQDRVFILGPGNLFYRVVF